MYLNVGKMAMSKEKQIFFIPLSQIYYFYVNDAKVYAVSQQSYLVRHSLDYLSRVLAPLNFFRCHKNYLVNIAKVDEIIPWFNSTLQLKLEAYEGRIPVSRNYLKSFKEQTGLST